MEEARLEKELIGTNLGRIRNQNRRGRHIYKSSSHGAYQRIWPGKRHPFLLHGAYQRKFSGRRQASLENQGGFAPTREFLLVGAVLHLFLLFDSSFLDSFSSLSSPSQSINLRYANPRSYVQAPCCLQIIATPWNHNELSKTLQSSSFLAR